MTIRVLVRDSEGIRVRVDDGQEWVWPTVAAFQEFLSEFQSTLVMETVRQGLRVWQTLDPTLTNTRLAIDQKIVMSQTTLVADPVIVTPPLP